MVTLPAGRTATALSTGNDFTCAILDDGSINCWGNNVNGALGDGTTNERLSPATVITPFGVQAIQISSGWHSTCAVFDNGQIQCWGNNDYGQLGTGTQTSSNSPQVVVTDSHLSAWQVTVGGNQACALFHEGVPKCWGRGNFGQLGHGSTSSYNNPYTVSTFDSHIPTHLEIYQGSSSSIHVNVAGWGTSSTVISTLPEGMEWNPTSRTLDVVGQNTTEGTHYVDLEFSDGTQTSIVNFSITIYPYIDPWSDRIASHSMGVGLLDDFDAKIPVTFDTSGWNRHGCFTTEDGPSYCWGYGQNGQLGYGSTSARDNPVQVYGINEEMRSISTGDLHTCGIKNDGEVVCWGYQYHGRLGYGSSGTGAENYPRTVANFEGKEGLMVTAGYEHSCAIMNDLELYCWGNNGHGELGVGDQSQKNSPVRVELPDGHRATDVSAGHQFTCAVLDNGSIACWGKASEGQLGIGSITSSQVEDEPVYALIPSERRAIAISTGYEHACAILDNQSVWCWGADDYGRIGIGEDNRQWPYEVVEPAYVDIPTGSTPVQISAGSRHTCATMSNGSMYCWGYDYQNSVTGPESSSSSGNYYYSPVHVQFEENERIVSMVAGGLSNTYGNTCAITQNARMRCWGGSYNLDYNPYLADSEIKFVNNAGTQKKVHLSGWASDLTWSNNVPSGISITDSILNVEPGADPNGQWNWMVNSSGFIHSGSLDFNGIDIDGRPNSVSAWTHNLAYTQSATSTPFVQVDSGEEHSCAILADGSLKCWGSGGSGRLGDGSTTSRSRPNAVQLDSDTQIKQVSAGGSHTCAVTTEARVLCWGEEDTEQLGLGETFGQDQKAPAEVMLSWNQNAVMVKAGYRHTCMLDDSGSIWCWGYNHNGELGQGSTNPTRSAKPLHVDLPLGRFATSIDIPDSGSHSCALLDDGTVWCWGRNNYGNFGLGSTSQSDETRPVQVHLPSQKKAVMVAVSYKNGCALMTDNTLWCWGENGNGAVGDGTWSDTGTPVEVNVGFYTPIVSMSIGDYNGAASVCTHHEDGTLNCWGENSQGQVGDGNNIDRNTPVQIQMDGGHDATSISVGASFACATTSDGWIQCWGDGGSYKLGDSSSEQRSSPGPVYGSQPAMTTILTFLEGETKQNELFVSGWNYAFSVEPAFPAGFALNPETGAIMADGQATFGVIRHTVTATAGAYTVSEEITIAIIRDTDGDGTPDTEDYDDDDDGHLDALDNCPSQAGTSSMGGYTGCPDSDGDDWADAIDPFDDDPTQWKDTDGDGFGDNANGTNPDIWPLDATQWVDDDNDGYGDNEFGTRGDYCPGVTGFSFEDVYGCPDSDGDGWSDDGEPFPNTPSQWNDRDGDGYGDNDSAGAELVDVFPSDGTQWADTDGDGYGDNQNGNGGDVFPNDPTEWRDTDGDGVGNNADAFPFDPTQTQDRDGDGYGDNPNGAGADLFPDNPTQWEDDDGDNLGDNLTGTDADPFLNDFDNDGYNDSIDILPSLYSPGDLDNDGVPDLEDWDRSDPRETSDFDGDGVGDNADTDDDNDGYVDTEELRQKTNPKDANEYPVDTFEIVLPGTSVGLGAWDLIGIFGGVPLFAWIGFGFATRNARCRKYERLLREARTPKELEAVALRSEYSLMIRLLGPHQGIRLERLRSELDDAMAGEVHHLPEILEPEDISEDQTHIVEDQMVTETVAPGPAKDVLGNVAADGYEWTVYEGINYYRIPNSDADWQQWQG
jgi:alpha-tubulin suppressor-like RCC1 family protein